MKKLIILLLALTMCLSLAACGGGHRNGCTICGKTASHTFQGSKYCSTHYINAVKWAFEHVS